MRRWIPLTRTLRGQWDKRKKKKKFSPAVGTLTTGTGTKIPMPLTEEEEAMQLTETLQRSTVEKRASNIPYLKGIRPLRLELQKKALEEVARRKVAMEAAK